MIEILMPSLSAALSAYVTWFFTKKKNRLDSEQVQLEIIQTWKGIADDLRAELVQVRGELKRVTEELFQLKKEIHQNK